MLYAAARFIYIVWVINHCVCKTNNKFMSYIRMLAMVIPCTVCDELLYVYIKQTA